MMGVRAMRNPQCHRRLRDRLFLTGTLPLASAPLALPVFLALSLALSLTACASAQEHFQRGLGQEGEGHAQEAMAEYDAALKADADFVKAWNNRALLHYRANDLDAADRDLDEALKRKPDFAPALVNRGLVYQARGKTAEALAAYESAVKADPDLLQAQFNAGSLLLKMGQHGRAVVFLEKALSIAPEDVDVQRAAARAWLGVGQVDRAYDTFKRLNARDGSDEEAMAGLAQSARATGRTREAVVLAERYSASRPDCLPCANLLASLYIEDRAPDRALSLLERIRDRFPKDARLRYRLALLYAGASRRADAIAQLEEYARLRGEAKDAESETAAKMLRALKGR